MAAAAITPYLNLLGIEDKQNVNANIQNLKKWFKYAFNEYLKAKYANKIPERFMFIPGPGFEHKRQDYDEKSDAMIKMGFKKFIIRTAEYFRRDNRHTYDTDMKWDRIEKKDFLERLVEVMYLEFTHMQRQHYMRGVKPVDRSINYENIRSLITAEKPGIIGIDGAEEIQVEEKREQRNRRQPVYDLEESEEEELKGERPVIVVEEEGITYLDDSEEEGEGRPVYDVEESEEEGPPPLEDPYGQQGLRRPRPEPVESKFSRMTDNELMNLIRQTNIPENRQISEMGQYDPAKFERHFRISKIRRLAEEELERRSRRVRRRITTIM